MIDSSMLPPVMPAQAGIHDLPSLQQSKVVSTGLRRHDGVSGPCVNV